MVARPRRYFDSDGPSSAEVISVRVRAIPAAVGAAGITSPYGSASARSDARNSVSSEPRIRISSGCHSQSSLTPSQPR
jgi:hypothetical protein